MVHPTFIAHHNGALQLSDVGCWLATTGWYYRFGAGSG